MVIWQIRRDEKLRLSHQGLYVHLESSRTPIWSSKSPERVATTGYNHPFLRRRSAVASNIPQLPFSLLLLLPLCYLTTIPCSSQRKHASRDRARKEFMGEVGVSVRNWKRGFGCLWDKNYKMWRWRGRIGKGKGRKGSKVCFLVKVPGESLRVVSRFSFFFFFWLL